MSCRCSSRTSTTRPRPRTSASTRCRTARRLTGIAVDASGQAARRSGSHARSRRRRRRRPRVPRRGAEGRDGRGRNVPVRRGERHGEPHHGREGGPRADAGDGPQGRSDSAADRGRSRATRSAASSSAPAGSPSAGALVRLESVKATTRWVETDAEGRFTIPHAPDGRGSIVVDAGDAGWGRKPDVKLPLGEGKSLTVTLALPASLDGKVVDDRTARVVPRAKVFVKANGFARLVRTGPDGTYHLKGIPPQTYRLAVDEARYVPWVKPDLALAPGEAKHLDIAVTLGATLAGKVVDENGAPVASARGTLMRGGENALAGHPADAARRRRDHRVPDALRRNVQGVAPRSRREPAPLREPRGLRARDARGPLPAFGRHEGRRGGRDAPRRHDLGPREGRERPADRGRRGPGRPVRELPRGGGRHGRELRAPRRPEHAPEDEDRRRRHVPDQGHVRGRVRAPDPEAGLRERARRPREGDRERRRPGRGDPRAGSEHLGHRAQEERGRGRGILRARRRRRPRDRRRRRPVRAEPAPTFRRAPTACSSSRA